MPNYAIEDVFGDHPVTGRHILIARAGDPIPADLDSLVAGEDKTSTEPDLPVEENRETATLSVPFAAIAADADADLVIGEAPFDGTVIDVSYTPEATITGANTDTRTLTVVNKGADGNGTTVVATLALAAGVTAADFDDKALPLTATVADRDVAEGDVLVFVSTHAGSTGLADPGGHVQVQINPSS